MTKRNGPRMARRGSMLIGNGSPAMTIVVRTLRATLAVANGKWDKFLSAMQAAVGERVRAGGER